MRSIRRYLIVTLALVLSLATLIIIAVIYQVTHHKAEDVLDVQLSLQGRIVASLLAPGTPEQEYARIARHLDQPGHPSRWFGDEGDAAQTPAAAPSRYHQDERMLTLGFWEADGSPWLMGAEWNDAGPFPAPQRQGYRWETYDGERWRVFSLILDDQQRWLSIGLREGFHDDLSWQLALGNLLPLLIALPALLLLVGLVVHYGLRPLASLSRQVAGRDAGQLGRLQLAVPRELQPLRDALNDFMARLEEALARERRFSADAAHELRTPLAALRVHLDNAVAGERDALPRAQGGIERLQRVVEQLLALVRLDQENDTSPVSVNLLALSQELAAEAWPQAHARDQQLFIDTDEAVWVEGNATELGMLIRNLLDNALRYTPPGGWVSVSMGYADGRAWLRVCDSGPGIDETLLALVTERFRRGSNREVEGSGLGLSIARQVARRQGVTLQLNNRPEGGLAAWLRWSQPTAS
ncbi:two-component system, OmpR family, sensor histidine kinase QseC [Franzmannia pantelleriensis]|uniref:histidine kinase n=1 Tax=Franzmannia pantelleriensis TaxID=48727 RepID=A0A1G9UEA3_9GAMM|nr:ATP-binding protein [Halomonas pantelleriensis]SDM58232.1 two-component system, OmpR family, sensor histidine kinase QseC [Halomonas pantelleriensis]